MTPKQEKFCQEIVKGQSQSAAYRVAFKPKRMKATSLHVKASVLAKSDKVRLRLAELMAPIKATTKLNAERWQEEIDRCALGDVRKLFDTHGNPIDIPLLDDDMAPVIAGFEIFEEFEGRGKDRVPIGFTRKYKLVDKLRALELAGKTRGYYVEKQKHEVDITLQALILAAMGSVNK